MHKRYTRVALAALLLAACEGEQGPMGPAGAQGPPGEPGPGTRIAVTAIVGSNGVAAANLPSEAGTMSNLPGVTCYLGETATGPHFVIGLDLEGPACGIAQSAGNLQALIISAPPGWSARFVVVY